MENCAIKIIKKLSCCITGKSIRSTEGQQQKQQRPGLPAQQQPDQEQQLLHQQTAASRDQQQRPAAQSGTTTLKIKRLLLQQPTTQSSEQVPAPTQDIVDYASALVIDERLACNDDNRSGPNGKMAQLPKDQLKSTSSSSKKEERDGIVMPSEGEGKSCGRSRVEEKNVNVVDDELTQRTDDTNKDINHSDIDRSFAIPIGEEDDDEDPYAELEKYLEKVKVSCLYCIVPLRGSSLSVGCVLGRVTSDSE